MDRPAKRLCAIAVLIGVGSLLFAGSAGAQEAEDATPDEVTDLMIEQLELENEKLRQEIRKLESDRGGLGLILTSITLMGAVVAATATAFGVVRQWRESNRQREADRRQRQQDAEQRLEERMAGLVANLGSDNEALQASSVASLLAFLMPAAPTADAEETVGLADPVRRTVWLVLANLKLDHSHAVQRQLVKVFERALRLYFPAIKEEAGTLLDLVGADLARIDLSGLSLPGVDIAFANLEHANLNGADLYRARGYGVKLNAARLSLLRPDQGPPVAVNLGEARLRKAVARGAHFHDARMNSARLEEADLSGAEFKGAHLQAVHFEDADLRGATFQGADVTGADFRGAQLDEPALRSLRRTRKNRKGVKSWKVAEFDPEHLAVLERT